MWQAGLEPAKPGLSNLYVCQFHHNHISLIILAVSSGLEPPHPVEDYCSLSKRVPYQLGLRHHNSFGDRERTWTSIGFTLHLLSGQTSYQLEYPTILCVSVGVCTREIWLMATLSKPPICNCLATVYLILRHFHSSWGVTLLSHQSGATRHLAMREGLEPSMVLPTAVFRTARLPIITPHHFWSNSVLLQQHGIFILCEDSATLTSVNILTCGGVDRTRTCTS